MAKPSKKKPTPPKKAVRKTPILKRLAGKLASKSKSINGLQEAQNLSLPKPQEVPFSPPAPVFAAQGFELPAHYGDNKIVALVRDPWWIWTYWEVTVDRERELIERLNLDKEKLVLRVYDVTGAAVENPRSWFDIEVTFLTGNWYVDVGIPDRDWVVELGIRSRDGRYAALVRSNVVRTPRFGVSDVLDEEWLMPDELYWKIFGLSGGLADLKSSMDVREIVDKYLRSIITSSEGLSSFGQATRLKREPYADISAKILEKP